MATTFGFEIASSRGDFHLTDSKYIRAGYMAVSTLAERDALPVDTGSGGVITEGSKCHVAEDGKDYIYKNNAWVEDSSGGGKVDDVLFDDVSKLDADKKVRLYTDAALKSAKLTEGIGWQESAGNGTITWDGNTVGKQKITGGGEFVLYQISPTTKISKSAVVGATGIIVSDGTDHTITVTADSILTMEDIFGVLPEGASADDWFTTGGYGSAFWVGCIHNAFTYSPTEHVTISFPEGLLFFGNVDNGQSTTYTKSFTYTPPTTIHKIDPAYLDSKEQVAGKAIVSDGAGGVTWGESGKVDDVKMDGVSKLNPTDKTVYLETDPALVSAKATHGIGYQSASPQTATITWDGVIGEKQTISLGRLGITMVRVSEDNAPIPTITDAIGTGIKVINDSVLQEFTVTSDNVSTETCTNAYIIDGGTTYPCTITVALQDNAISQGVTYPKKGIWYAQPTGSVTTYLKEMTYTYQGTVINKIDPDYLDTTDAGAAGKALLSDGTGGVTWGEAGKVDDVLFDGVSKLDPDKKVRLYTDAALASAKITEGIGWQESAGTGTITWDGVIGDKTYVGPSNQNCLVKLSTETPAVSDMLGKSCKDSATHQAHTITSDMIEYPIVTRTDTTEYPTSWDCDPTGKPQITTTRAGVLCKIGELVGPSIDSYVDGKLKIRNTVTQEDQEITITIDMLVIWTTDFNNGWVITYGDDTEKDCVFIANDNATIESQAISKGVWVNIDKIASTVVSYVSYVIKTPVYDTGVYNIRFKGKTDTSVSWNGDTTGKPTAFEGMVCKVSDVVITGKSDIFGKTLQESNSDGEVVNTVTMNDDNINDMMFGYAYGIGSVQVLFVVKEFSMMGDTFTPGIWCGKNMDDRNVYTSLVNFVGYPVSDEYVTISNKSTTAVIDGTSYNITAGIWSKLYVSAPINNYVEEITYGGGTPTIHKIDPAYLDSKQQTAGKTILSDGAGGVTWGSIDVSDKMDKLPAVDRAAAVGHFPMFKSDGNVEDSGVFFEDEPTTLEIPGDKPVVYNYNQNLQPSEKATARGNINAAGTDVSNTFSATNTFTNLTTFNAGILIGTGENKPKLSQGTNGELKIETVDVYINEDLYPSELRLTGLEKLENTSGVRLINPNSGTTASQTLQTLTLDGVTYKLAGSALAVDSYQSLVTIMNALPAEEYDVGQSIFVKTLNVPDLWIYSNNEATSVPYTYVSDTQFIADLKTAEGALQIGYYKVAQLEIEKIDLTNYVQFDNYASASKAGVVFAEPAVARDNTEVHINSDHKLVVSTPKVIYL